MNLNSPQVADQLTAAKAQANANVVTLMDSLQAEYANADSDYRAVLAGFQQAQNSLNDARTRRTRAAQALAAYGVTVDQ